MEAAAWSLGASAPLSARRDATKSLRGGTEIPSYLPVLPSPCTVRVCCPPLSSC